MVKTYDINAKEALIGDWEEVNKEINPCDVCSKNNFKVCMIAKEYWFLNNSLTNKCALVFPTREIYSNQNTTVLKWSIWVSYKTKINNFFADFCKYLQTIDSTIAPCWCELENLSCPSEYSWLAIIVSSHHKQNL